MQNPLSHFRFAQFQFLVKTIDHVSLPAYKGSTLRGGFGHAFKQVVCANKQKICDSCLLKEKCVYSYVFETPPPSNTSKMRKYPYAPHPFVITPPLEEKREYRQGETLCFGLTLIGKAVDHLPYFIYTFEEFGQMGIGKGRGKFQLEEVQSVGGPEERVVYTAGDQVLRRNSEVIEANELIRELPSDPISSIILQFVTPARLKYDGQLGPALEFHVLIRNLLRRISLLSYFHCGEELDLDFRGLIDSSMAIRVRKKELRWHDWQRYSNRQNTAMMMGGCIGSITFAGNLTQFMPFLLLGEKINVGKGTSFGLGKYRLQREQSVSEEELK